jgi:hypothetical protein
MCGGFGWRRFTGVIERNGTLPPSGLEQSRKRQGAPAHFRAD